MWANILNAKTINCTSNNKPRPFLIVEVRAGLPLCHLRSFHSHKNSLYPRRISVADHSLSIYTYSRRFTICGLRSQILILYSCAHSLPALFPSRFYPIISRPFFLRAPIPFFILSHIRMASIFGEYEWPIYIVTAVFLVLTTLGIFFNSLVVFATVQTK